MDIFKNAERSVSSYSFNKKDLRKIDVVSDAYVSNEALRRIAAQEKALKESAELERVEARERNNSRLEKVVANSLTESRIIQRMNTLASVGKTELYKSILFEMLYCSLPIDNDFLFEHSAAVKALTDDYIDSHNGFNGLVKAAESSRSVLLSRMKSICESMVTEVCNRKLKEMQQCDPNTINFDLTDDEKDKFKYDIKDLDLDEISKLIKDKVITVVNDSKKQEQANKKLIADIENDLKENDEVTDEKSVKEALSNMIISSTPIEHATLFNALIRSTYRDMLLENVAIVSADKDNIDADHDNSEHYDIDASIDNVIDNETDPYKSDDINDLELDMDTIITEAITKYTLMEMLYTIQLENYTASDIRKLSEKLVNPK